MVESRKVGNTNFMSGVLWLSLSTLLVKLIGLIYKVPMLSYLGAVGMGYFHSAYELYALLCVIATAGLPVALSVLISAALAREDSAEVGRIYRVAMRIFLVIGGLGCGAMLGLARWFCRLIQSENAYLCIVSIAPTVLFVCVSSAYRGYFQGYGKMAPTAISQLLEAVGKLGFGLLFANYAYRHGMDTPRIAAAAGWGLTLGTAVSTLYLAVEKYRFGAETAGRGEKTHSQSVLRSLAKLSVPMTLGASAVSLTKLVDMTMILRRLQAIGYTEAMANEAYGSYTALALSVFGLIPSLVNAVALPLIPKLSAAIERGDRERQAQMVRISYRLTALFAIPAALGVSAFARPVLLLLFGNEPDAVEAAAPLLSLLGVSVFLSCMITATNSVLHAYRSVNRPILSMLAGAVVKIVSAYLLIGIPQIGIFGAPVSTFLCNLIVVMLNLVFAYRLCRTDGTVAVFFRPLVAGTVAVGGAFTVYHLLLPVLSESSMLTLIALSTAVILYLPLSCICGALGEEELAALPGGERWCRVCKRLRLMRGDHT